jgi:hypothetical protein
MTLIGGVLVSFMLLFLHTMRTRGKLPYKVERLAPESATLAQARVARERGTYGPLWRWWPACISGRC